MKNLRTFETLSTLTSSGANAGYPAANVKDLDPMLRWWADAYATDCWLKVDFGSAKNLTAAFLNQANFPHCHIQGHASDSWGSPSFDLGCDLVLDEAGNRKGWFDLSAFAYRWLRILIPSGQTLDGGDTVPKLGNLLAGVSETWPVVSSLEVVLQQKKYTFEPDGGGYWESNKGRARHVISIEMGDDLANIRAMNKTWTIGVVFADLANAGEAWLVFPPDSYGKPIKSVTNANLRFTVKERT